jgi:2-polyprenyl-3-methyl-5-hydroxy-6-metoxy-1,4-benzoquinol methylase
MSSSLRQAAGHYKRWPKLYYYAMGKIALDPAYPAVAKTLGNSTLPLLDLGCGIGLLAAYLRASGHRAPIVGWDVDEKKIEVAKTILPESSTSFRTGDALDFSEHRGDVVMLDVLHYFNDKDQEQLLTKVAASIAPQGVALIRLALNEPSWRFTVTRAEEWFVHFIRWIPMQGGNFPTRDEVSLPFAKEGLEVEVRPMWGWTPFNSHLFTIRRRI